MLGAIGADRGGQRRHHRRDGVGDTQFPAHTAPRLAGTRDGRFQLRDERPRLGEKRDAGGRQRDPAPGAIEEIETDLALELADLLTQGGLGRCQRLRRPAEVQLGRHRNEVPQMA